MLVDLRPQARRLLPPPPPRLQPAVAVRLAHHLVRTHAVKGCCLIARCSCRKHERCFRYPISRAVQPDPHQSFWSLLAPHSHLFSLLYSTGNPFQRQAGGAAASSTSASAVPQPSPRSLKAQTQPTRPAPLPTAGSADSGLSLALADLRTRFFEYELLETEAARAAMLPSLLPLFLDVFEGVPPADVLRQFRREALQSFAMHVSHFLVRAVRRLAADQSTEAASTALASFLAEDPVGQDAVRTLLLLANVGDVAIEPMASMSLPSTLVKALYLFLDLPALPATPQPPASTDNGASEREQAGSPSGARSGEGEGEAGAAETATAAVPGVVVITPAVVPTPETPAARRAALEETFTQLLCRLFQQRKATQETLSAVDAAGVSDISRLFDLIVTPCAPHNYGWRRAAMCVIGTMFTHTLDAALVTYVHKRGLVRQTLDGALLTPDLDLETCTDVLECLADCLYRASALRASLLLDDFAREDGYRRLVRVILEADAREAVEESTATAAAAADSSEGLAAEAPLTTATATANQQLISRTTRAGFLRRLIVALTRLTFAGQLDLKFETGRDGLQDPAFRFPKPSGFGLSVRNLVAFHALQSLFLKSVSQVVSTAAMDSIFDVYTRDHVNYFVLRGERTLCKLLERLDSMAEPALRRVLKLLEFVVCSLNYVPEPELRALSLKLKNAEARVSAAILHVLVKFINFNSKYADVCRELGLLDVVIGRLLATVKQLKEQSSTAALEALRESQQHPTAEVR